MAAIALPPGTKLESQLSASQSMEALQAVVAGYRAPQYPDLPQVVDASYQLGSGTSPPASVVTFEDSASTVTFVTLWPAAHGTTVGHFPRDTSVALFKDWRSYDPTLTINGDLPGAMLNIRAPQLDPTFPAEIVSTAGYPVTPRNTARIVSKLAEMFLIKAQQFIASRDLASASRFATQHRVDVNAGIRDLQRILDGLGEWNAQVILYVQDLPLRCRALLLQGARSGGNSPWDELER